MAVHLGSGGFTFEVHEDWAKLPEGLTLGDVAAVGVDRQDRVYAFNHGEHPVAVFDANGKFETQWNNLHRPNGMCMATGSDPLVYIGEGGPSGEINRDWPNIGPRVTIHTLKGKVLARLGKMHAGLAPGQFTSPHGIAVDRHGNIYVGELSGRVWARLSKEPPPKRIRVIHTLVKVAA
jgi:sugar lactone lactonase YvrE